jgi:dCMP deaminase
MATVDWDTRYLELAKLVATWSKDKAQVGAVVVRNNRVVATGFNGFPTDVLDDERLTDKATKQAMVVHAEENALLVAGDRAVGATLYVHGKPICARCAASLIQAGIKRVVAQRPQRGENTNKPKSNRTNQPGEVDWNEMGLLANEMFAEAGIQVHHKEWAKQSPASPSSEATIPSEVANDDNGRAKLQKQVDGVKK